MEYVSSEIVRGVLVIGFPTATIVDSLTVRSVADEIIARVEDMDCRRLVLDFAGVGLVTSELIGRLVSLRKYCQVQGIKLKLAGLSAGFKEVLEITNLSSYFKTYRTRNSAIEMFVADDFMIRHEFFETYANSESEDFSNAAPVALVPLRLTLDAETNVF